MPRTVLHLMETPDPGGAETLLLNLVARLDPGRYRSVVGTFRPGWLTAELARRGIPSVVLPLRRPLDPAWLARALRLVRRAGVELVHAHEFTMNTYGTLLGRLGRLPVIATVHGKAYYADRTRRRLAYRFVGRAASQVVAVSHDVRRFLLEEVGLAPEAVVTIHNGVAPPPPVSPAAAAALRHQLGLPAGTPVVGTVGTLLPVKGHADLLEAVARLAPAVPDLTALICGRPLVLEPLAARAAALGIADRVRFLGYRDDVPALLAVMDVFVLPSLSEGLSLALLEAMAAGLPVVATAVGGNPEVVRDGESGFLVPPRDPGALAERIGRLLRDRALARRLGLAAARRVRQEFSLDAMVQRYEALYARHLARRPHDPAAATVPA
ncbi:MAG TPA: glycosyltransferase [Thermodesulfobacteriota bacterium]|nr:glycosyltransferase [Thermodesulfobacteriota bacterium]